ncbi:MAG: hypothetical protein H0V51_09875, partial [Chloroflexi bacterium]|nr:hypothetical protein [Chloroflexota bacterium]
MRADRLLFFGAALGYLAAPGHPSAWLAGLPLGSIGIAAGIALVGWAIALPGAPPRARLVGALLVGGVVVKLLLAWSAPAYGLLAEYRSGGSEARLERSTEWRGTGANATRVDPALDFRGDEFPLHFFNDARRFNYFSASQPRRDLLPFAARWTGQVWAPNGGRYRFALEANGQATLTVPGLVGPRGEPPAVTSGQRVQEVLAHVELPAGLHPIEVRYARPEEGMPWLVVRGAEGDGALLPLTPPVLVREGTSVSALARDRFLGAGAMALDLTILGLLLLALIGQARQASSRVAAAGSGERLERTLLGLFAVAALGVELVNHGHLVGRATILSGGNDWLAYEGFARDVLLDGPLLSEGRALGQ